MVTLHKTFNFVQHEVCRCFFFAEFFLFTVTLFACIACVSCVKSGVAT